MEHAGAPGNRLRGIRRTRDRLEYIAETPIRFAGILQNTILGPFGTQCETETCCGESLWNCGDYRIHFVTDSLELQGPPKRISGSSEIRKGIP